MTPKRTIKIIFAEDHEIFRTGFKRIMESSSPKNYHFVAEAVNGLDLVEKVKRLKPDLVLTDIRMPEMDGIQACTLIKLQSPKTEVIAFSQFDQEDYILGMMNAGATGYLAKSGSITEIFEAIATVSDGQPYYCSTISNKLYGLFENSNTCKSKKRQIQFSLQELKIIKLICRQQTTKEIAHALSISVRTVEDYRRGIQEKIGARNLAGIVVHALTHSLVKQNELSI